MEQRFCPVCDQPIIEAVTDEEVMVCVVCFIDGLPYNLQEKSRQEKRVILQRRWYEVREWFVSYHQIVPAAENEKAARHLLEEPTGNFISEEKTEDLSQPIGKKEKRKSKARKFRKLLDQWNRD